MQQSRYDLISYHYDLIPYSDSIKIPKSISTSNYYDNFTGRFYQGRRCSDDVRQIGRGNGVIGPGGRWRRNLANKVLASGLPLDQGCAKVTISPKIRQLLQVFCALH